MEQQAKTALELSVEQYFNIIAIRFEITPSDDELKLGETAASIYRAAIKLAGQQNLSPDALKILKKYESVAKTVMEFQKQGDLIDSLEAALEQEKAGRAQDIDALKRGVDKKISEHQRLEQGYTALVSYGAGPIAAALREGQLKPLDREAAVRASKLWAQQVTVRSPPAQQMRQKLEGAIDIFYDSNSTQAERQKAAAHILAATVVTYRGRPELRQTAVNLISIPSNILVGVQTAPEAFDRFLKSYVGDAGFARAKQHYASLLVAVPAQKQDAERKVGEFSLPPQLLREALPQAQLANDEEDSTSVSNVGEVFECPACGARVGATDTKCKKCGAEFVEDEDDVAPAQSPLASDSSNQGTAEVFECPECGGTVGAGESKCSKCGVEFEE